MSKIERIKPPRFKCINCGSEVKAEDYNFMAFYILKIVGLCEKCLHDRDAFALALKREVIKT